MAFLIKTGIRVYAALDEVYCYSGFRTRRFGAEMPKPASCQPRWLLCIKNLLPLSSAQLLADQSIVCHAEDTENPYTTQ